jgi:hypothetical protein
MNKMRDANHTATEFDFMNERVDVFTKAIQDVLRNEWRRVKWGEPLYRIVFCLVTFGMVVSFIVILNKSYPWIFHFISKSQYANNMDFGNRIS